MTERFSFNQATATNWPMPDLAGWGGHAAGVSTVGPWRERISFMD